MEVSREQVYWRTRDLVKVRGEVHSAGGGERLRRVVSRRKDAEITFSPTAGVKRTADVSDAPRDDDALAPRRMSTNRDNTKLVK